MTPSPALRSELAALRRRRALRRANHQSTAKIDEDMRRITATLLARETRRMRVTAKTRAV